MRGKGWNIYMKIGGFSAYFSQHTSSFARCMVVKIEVNVDE